MDSYKDLDQLKLELSNFRDFTLEIKAHHLHHVHLCKLSVFPRKHHKTMITFPGIIYSRFRENRKFPRVADSCIILAGLCWPCE